MSGSSRAVTCPITELRAAAMHFQECKSVKRRRGRSIVDLRRQFWDRRRVFKGPCHETCQCDIGQSPLQCIGFWSQNSDIVKKRQRWMFLTNDHSHAEQMSITLMDDYVHLSHCSLNDHSPIPHIQPVNLQAFIDICLLYKLSESNLLLFCFVLLISLGIHKYS